MITEQGGITTFPAVAGDDDHRTAPRTSTSPSTDEGLDYLAQPGAARPIGHDAPRRSYRHFGLANPQGWGDPGQSGAEGEDLDLSGEGGDHPMSEPEQGVGVRLHGPGNVEQEHHTARSGPRRR